MKKINNDELNNVNGGTSSEPGMATTCSKCLHVYSFYGADDSREVGSGCDSYYELKCPNCGTWNKEGNEVPR